MMPLCYSDLPPDVVRAGLERAGGRVRKRKRKLSLERLMRLEVWRAMVAGASYNAALEEQWVRLEGLGLGLGERPSSGSLAEARMRLPVEVMECAFERVRDAAAGESEPFARYRGMRVVGCDGSSFTTAREDDLLKFFGSPGADGCKGYYPVGKWSALSLLFTGVILEQEVGPYRSGEAPQAMRLIERGLRENDLFMGDSAYGCFPVLAAALSKGAHVLCAKMGSIDIEARTVAGHGEPDRDVEITSSARTLRRYRGVRFPKSLRLRAVLAHKRCEDGSMPPLWLLTDLDRSKFSAREIAALYAKRWNKETFFGDVKTRLGMAVMQSRRVHTVMLEYHAHLTAHNLVRLSIIRAAGRHASEPLRISYTAARRRLVETNRSVAYNPSSFTTAVERLYRGIAREKTALRPGRSEPRKVRPPKKPYPTFTETRKKWRLKRCRSA